MRRTLVVIAIAVVGALSQSMAQTASPRTFVLDETERSVAAIDIATGAVLKTATVQGQPTGLVRTPDGRRLLVLDRGLGRDAGDAGYQAKSKSALTILDATTLEVQARVELGWGLDFTALMPLSGDRVSLLCPGYVGRKPDETLPREMITVNLTTGQITGRLALPRPVASFFSTPDGTTAVVLSARDRPKQTPPPPAELRFIDLAGPTLLTTLTLEGDPQKPVLSPDGAFVYLLDPGKPSGNPERNVNGRLYIVSKETRTLVGVSDVGSKPRGFVLDEAGHQLLLLSDSPPVKDSKAADRGELRVIRGGSILPPIKVATKPEFIRAAPGANRLFIVSEKAITGYALPDLTPLTSTPDNGISNTEVAVTPDGRRAFSVWETFVQTFDLESGKELKKITTGRMSALILQAVDAAISTAASKRTAEQEAIRKGRSHYTYTEYSLRDPNPALAMRPDGKAVYALNRQTADVTIVDTETGAVVEKVGADGFDVRFLPAANVALVIGSSRVHAIDMSSNKKLDDFAPGTAAAGFTRVDMSPDGKYAIVQGSGGVLLIDGSSSPVKAKMVTRTRLAAVEFEWANQR